jgi:CBS domain containing-hemolysin-like protein
MTIDDVNEALGTDLDTSYARTLAGLVLNKLGRRPREGDEVRVGDVLLQVEQLDGHRITRLLVRVDGDRSYTVARDSSGSQGSS